MMENIKIQTAKILIVEDDLNLGYLLSEYLESEGYSVKLIRDGKSGLDAFLKDSFSLCILDVNIPNLDGFELARYMRSERPDIPFLFLTARSLKQDKLKGYSLGADDYITKPFDEEELICRIDVILRRNLALSTQPEEISRQFSLGEYHFNYHNQELTWRNQRWRLTEKESEVLRLLCEHKNQILPREDAVEKIYGKRDYFLGRSFDVFISKLRKLLKKDPGVSIENVFGVGFILNLPEKESINRNHLGDI